MTYPSHPARARLRVRVAAWENEVCAQQVVLAATRLALLMRKAGFDPAEPRIPVGTWVATFVDGKFYGHVGVFMGYEPNGTLILLDQFNKAEHVLHNALPPQTTALLW